MPLLPMQGQARRLLVNVRAEKLTPSRCGPVCRDKQMSACDLRQLRVSPLWAGRVPRIVDTPAKLPVISVTLDAKAQRGPDWRDQFWATARYGQPPKVARSVPVCRLRVRAYCQ
jgi:hypothetical protein